MFRSNNLRVFVAGLVIGLGMQAASAIEFEGPKAPQTYVDAKTQEEIPAQEAMLRAIKGGRILKCQVMGLKINANGGISFTKKSK